MKNHAFIGAKDRVQLLALSSLVLVWLGVLKLVGTGSEGGSTLP